MQSIITGVLPLFIIAILGCSVVEDKSKPKQNTGKRPGQESESLEGYLVDPTAVSFKTNGNKVKVSLPVTAIEPAADTLLSSLYVNVWYVDSSNLQIAAIDLQNEIKIAATLKASQRLKNGQDINLSFELTETETNGYFFLTIGDKGEGSFITEEMLSEEGGKTSAVARELGYARTNVPISNISIRDIGFEQLKLPTGGGGLWITLGDLHKLSDRSDDWTSIKSIADTDNIPTPNLGENGQDTAQYVMANALAFGKTLDPTHKDRVIAVIRNLLEIPIPENLSQIENLYNLVTFYIAADIVGIVDADDIGFRKWFSQLENTTLQGKTWTDHHRLNPNGLGTVSGSLRFILAYEGGRTDELDTIASIFAGYFDREIYSGFQYGTDDSWHSDTLEKVPIAPAGTLLNGNEIGGLLPEAAAASGSYSWPLSNGEESWNALAGMALQAELLKQAGYPTWGVGSQGLGRAAHFLSSHNLSPPSDFAWVLELIDGRTDFNLAESTAPLTGLGPGFARWLYPK